jgi:hypothetical protein
MKPDNIGEIFKPCTLGLSQGIANDRQAQRNRDFIYYQFRESQLRGDFCRLN